MTFFRKLIQNNSGVSSKNFFLVLITLIGLFLLLVPGVILMIEACCNHTVQTDLTGMAAYIGAVAGLFGVAGWTKAWSEKWECQCKQSKKKKEEIEITDRIDEDEDLSDRDYDEN